MNDDAKAGDRKGSVGVVRTQVAHFAEPLRLRAGGVLPEFTIAYETYGTLNPDRTNAILICHALSGDAHVAGYHTDDPTERPGWWDDAVGPGRMFDTDRYFVICSNVIGGCSGSTEDIGERGHQGIVLDTSLVPPCKVFSRATAEG